MILHPRILIIAPEQHRGQAVEALLAETQFQVSHAADVLSAMAALKASEVDVVLLDDNPQEFFLTDSIRILKCLNTASYLPIICLSDAAMPPGHLAETLEAGADDYLSEPIDSVELCARIRKVLSMVELHREFAQSKCQLEEALGRESQLLRQLRSDNRQLKQRSVTDGLTSLYNHRYLMEWLKTEFKIARRYGHPISFIMADIDHFKQVNDKYGHPFGDYVIKEVAVLAGANARESDLVARYGGEEFAMVLPRSDRTMARTFAERFHRAVGEHEFSNANHSVNLTISLGLATYPLDAEVTSPEVLVYLADQALLEAKARGRNTVVAWHELDVEKRVRIRRRLSNSSGELCPVHEECGCPK